MAKVLGWIRDNLSLTDIPLWDNTNRENFKINSKIASYNYFNLLKQLHQSGIKK